MIFFQNYLSCLSPFRKAIPYFSKEEDNLPQFSDEIILHIFKYAFPFTFVPLSLTCRRLYRIANDPVLNRLWKDSKYGTIPSIKYYESDVFEMLPMAGQISKKIIHELALHCPFVRGKYVHETHILMRRYAGWTVGVGQGVTHHFYEEKSHPSEYQLLLDVDIVVTHVPKKYAHADFQTSYHLIQYMWDCYFVGPPMPLYSLLCQEGGVKIWIAAPGALKFPLPPGITPFPPIDMRKWMDRFLLRLMNESICISGEYAYLIKDQAVLSTHSLMRTSKSTLVKVVDA